MTCFSPAPLQGASCYLVPFPGGCAAKRLYHRLISEAPPEPVSLKFTAGGAVPHLDRLYEEEYAVANQAGFICRPDTGHLFGRRFFRSRGLAQAPGIGAVAEDSATPGLKTYSCQRAREDGQLYPESGKDSASACVNSARLLRLHRCRPAGSCRRS